MLADLNDESYTYEIEAQSESLKDIHSYYLWPKAIE